MAYGSRVAVSYDVGRRCGLDPTFGVAVAQAGSCSSDLAPSLGTSICRGCGPEEKKKIFKKRETRPVSCSPRKVYLCIESVSIGSRDLALELKAWICSPAKR